MLFINDWIWQKTFVFGDHGGALLNDLCKEFDCIVHKVTSSKT